MVADQNLKFLIQQIKAEVFSSVGSVANSLLSQELKLCFSDTKFTKALYTKNILGFS